MHQLSDKELVEALKDLAAYMAAISNNADANLILEAVRRMDEAAD